MADRSWVRWGRTLALAGMVSLLVASTAAAEFRVAVVDMQRALNECDAGKRAKDSVKSKFERAQDQLKNQRESLDRRREDYEKKATVMREEERRNLEKELESETLEFKRKYEDFQRDLKRTDSELTSGIVEELYAIVNDYGREQGYTLVLEASSGALLYADKSLDITDQIVALHNSAPHKSKKSE
ncbi:MAG TPA: OmpH family outer membrane protein [Candidatus Binatia bacterium]|jgi:outer membrane protein|nr:OmpH family outer membrane protein [Candidatus Binatia bacterium]